MLIAKHSQTKLALARRISRAAQLENDNGDVKICKTNPHLSKMRGAMNCAV
jgi:hypothetical protein